MDAYPEQPEAVEMQLRPVQPADWALLYAWRNDLAALPLWYPRRHPLSFEQFEREFREQEASSTHVRFIIQAREQAIGTVYTYNHSPLHGWAYLAAYLAPEFRKQGLATRAVRRFTAWLFDNYPLRKLYAEVYGFNRESRSALDAAGIQPEAALRQHLYWQGGYHDLLLYAITREQFIEAHITGAAMQAAGATTKTETTDENNSHTASLDSGNPHSNPRERR